MGVAYVPTLPGESPVARAPPSERSLLPSSSTLTTHPTTDGRRFRGDLGRDGRSLDPALLGAGPGPPRPLQHPLTARQRAARGPAPQLRPRDVAAMAASQYHGDG